MSLRFGRDCEHAKVIVVFVGVFFLNTVYDSKNLDGSDEGNKETLEKEFRQTCTEESGDVNSSLMGKRPD